MKLKRVIARGLLASMGGLVLSTPVTAIETESYSVDTTLSAKYEENVDVVSIENLAVPTVATYPTVSVVQIPEVGAQTETEKTEEKSLAIYTTEYLNVREKPSEESEIIDVLAPNTEIFISEQVNDDWFSFEYGEHLYYVNAGYVAPFAQVSEDDIIGLEENSQVITEYLDEESEEGVITTAKKKKKKITKKKSTRKKKKKIEKKKKIQKKKAEYSASYFKRAGVINWGGYRWTYYSEKVLPGGGLKIPGRHNDEDGYICDENEYICLASSTLKKGTVVDTPFGKQGKIYDCGCAAGTMDVYVGW